MSLSPRVNRRNSRSGRSPNRRDLSPPPVYYNHNGHRTPPNPSQNHPRSKREVHSPTGEPLLEPDALPRQPPLAPSEKDELDSSGDDRERVNYPQPGVDDGLMPDNNNPDAEFFTPGPEKVPIEPPYGTNPEFDDPEFGPPEIYPRNNFPSAPGYGPDFTEFNGSESIPDVNVYQHKKTLAQGMMDLALFSANASQLRYVLEAGGHVYFIISVILISFSLILQVAIGVGLIWNSRYNVKDKKQICIANKISNFTIIGIFLVTVVNVFISAFGVSSPAAVPVLIAPRYGDITDLELETNTETFQNI